MKESQKKWVYKNMSAFDRVGCKVPKETSSLVELISPYVYRINKLQMEMEALITKHKNERR